MASPAEAVRDVLGDDEEEIACGGEERAEEEQRSEEAGHRFTFRVGEAGCVPGASLIGPERADLERILEFHRARAIRASSAEFTRARIRAAALRAASSGPGCSVAGKSSKRAIRSARATNSADKARIDSARCGRGDCLTFAMIPFLSARSGPTLNEFAPPGIGPGGRQELIRPASRDDRGPTRRSHPGCRPESTPCGPTHRRPPCPLHRALRGTRRR